MCLTVFYSTKICVMDNAQIVFRYVSRVQTVRYPAQYSKKNDMATYPVHIHISVYNLCIKYPITFINNVQNMRILRNMQTNRILVLLFELHVHKLDEYHFLQ